MSDNSTFSDAHKYTLEQTIGAYRELCEIRESLRNRAGQCLQSSGVLLAASSIPAFAQNDVTVLQQFLAVIAGLAFTASIGCAAMIFLPRTGKVVGSNPDMRDLGANYIAASADRAWVYLLNDYERGIASERSIISQFDKWLAGMCIATLCQAMCLIGQVISM